MRTPIACTASASRPAPAPIRWSARRRSSPDRDGEDLRAGFAGTTVSFVNFKNELPYFIDTVLPLLREAGLRTRTCHCEERSDAAIVPRSMDTGPQNLDRTTHRDCFVASLLAMTVGGSMLASAAISTSSGNGCHGCVGSSGGTAASSARV